MSINELFSPNDLSLFFGNIHTSGQTINGNLIVTGNESVGGNLGVTGDINGAAMLNLVDDANIGGNLSVVDNNHVFFGTAPNYWGIYKNTVGNNNLVFIQGGNAVNQSVALQLGTGGLLVDGSEIINGNLNVNGTFEMRALDVIHLGASPNEWGIYRNTGANQNLVFYQNGTATNSSISLQTGTGRLEASNMYCAGSFFDGLAVDGNPGQILTSTGISTKWDTINQTAFLQSVSPVATGDFIGNYGHDPIYFKSAYSMLDNGILTDVLINTSIAPGIGLTYLFTLYKNNVATAFTASIADAATSVRVTFNESFNANDSIAFLYTSAAVPPIANISFGFYKA